MSSYAELTKGMPSLIWTCPKCSRSWWHPDFWKAGKETYCLDCGEETSTAGER